MNRMGTGIARRTATTAPPRAVPSSFVTIETRERHGGGELPGLRHRVLAHRAVEHEQRFVRRSRPAFAHDAHHLLQLLQQPGLGVQPPGGVHEHRVASHGRGPRRWRRTPRPRDRRAHPPPRRRARRDGRPTAAAATRHRRGTCPPRRGAHVAPPPRAGARASRLWWSSRRRSRRTPARRSAALRRAREHPTPRGRPAARPRPARGDPSRSAAGARRRPSISSSVAVHAEIGLEEDPLRFLERRDHRHGRAPVPAAATDPSGESLPTPPRPFRDERRRARVT